MGFFRGYHPTKHGSHFDFSPIPKNMGIGCMTNNIKMFRKFKKNTLN